MFSDLPVRHTFDTVRSHLMTRPSHAQSRHVGPTARDGPVENISLHSVYDTTKCTRDGDMLTAGGAVGGVPFEPCRRRSHAPALSHASPPWQSRVKHALSYRDHGAVPGKRPVAWATANQYRISVTITSYSPVREPGAGRGSVCAVGRCVWCIRGPGDIPPRHA